MNQFNFFLFFGVLILCSSRSLLMADDGLYFHGYPCLEDCSGHEAGFEWAESNGITDADDCGGNSQSFIEGCLAFAGETGEEQDQVEETDEAEEEESDFE